MPFRLRKSIKFGKGLKFNLSKSGISTTIGKRGASVNIGKRGVKTTVGIPGTGISHSSGGHSVTGRRTRKGCCSLFALLPIVLLLLLQIIAR